MAREIEQLELKLINSSCALTGVAGEVRTDLAP